MNCRVFSIECGLPCTGAVPGYQVSRSALVTRAIEFFQRIARRRDRFTIVAAYSLYLTIEDGRLVPFGSTPNWLFTRPLSKQKVLPERFPQSRNGLPDVARLPLSVDA